MRPGDFFELSHYLAIRLQESIQGGAAEPVIPVLLAHPADIPRSGSGESSRAALYLHRIIPSSIYRDAGIRVQPTADPALPGKLCRGDLWLELHFVFMVIEATPRDELGALAAAIDFLHSNAPLSVADMDACIGKELSIAAGELPLELVDEPGLWQELGLGRHHRGISFKVTLPVAASRGEEVERVLERELSLGLVTEEERE